MSKCYSCNSILTKYNTNKWGFGILYGFWYLRFYRLCDKCCPSIISIRSDK